MAPVGIMCASRASERIIVYAVALAVAVQFYTSLLVHAATSEVVVGGVVVAFASMVAFHGMWMWSPYGVTDSVAWVHSSKEVMLVASLDLAPAYTTSHVRACLWGDWLQLRDTGQARDIKRIVRRVALDRNKYTMQFSNKEIERSFLDEFMNNGCVCPSVACQAW